MPESRTGLPAGRYRILAPLGRGGMGAVWRAEDTALGRQVAIKELRLPEQLAAGQREAWQARMEREARAAARLKHPGIITVHDRITGDDGRPWIVMELIEGGSLDDLLRERGRLDAGTAAGIGRQMLSALAAAHAQGVVHRDIKPANVLLEGDRVVLTDFGIAALEGDVALTQSGVLLGTPAYMAPEQVRGRPGTPQSDLWSLGATLYAAVEGRLPFDADTHGALFVAIATEPPTPPTHAGPLAPVLTALLAKDPAARPTAEQLLSTGPLAARPTAGRPPVTLQPAGTARTAKVLAPRPKLPTAPAPRSGPEAEPEPGTASTLALRGPAAGREETATAAVGGEAAFPSRLRRARGRLWAVGAVAAAAVLLAGAMWVTRPSRYPSVVISVGATWMSVDSVAFSPDGKTLASGGLTGVPQLWDVAGHRFLKAFQPDGGASGTGSVAFSPDGRTLAAAAVTANAVRLWDIASGRQTRSFSTGTGEPGSIAFTSDGRTLAGTDSNGTIQLWDAANGGIVAAPLDMGGLEWTSVSLTVYGSTLLGSGANRLQLWDLAHRRPIAALPLDGTLPAGSTLTGDGGYAAAPVNEGVELWAAVTGKRIATLTDPGEHAFNAVAFSPDGATLAAGGGNGHIVLWATATGERIATLSGHTGAVNALAFSPDGATLASGSKDATIRLWKLR